jgi:hypothetical protein
MFPLFFLGFMVGAAVWLCWTMPLIGIVLSILILIGVLRVRFRWVSAFFLGLFLGFM